jgi:hypothetical protein
MNFKECNSKSLIRVITYRFGEFLFGEIRFGENRFGESLFGESRFGEKIEVFISFN